MACILGCVALLRKVPARARLYGQTQCELAGGEVLELGNFESLRHSVHFCVHHKAVVYLRYDASMPFSRVRSTKIVAVVVVESVEELYLNQHYFSS